MKPSRDISRLIEIMAALRTPGSGCPWDLEQNFRTIAPYTLEEAYEVADAIARDDLAGLKDELGDLLLQVVFHARMAQEQGAFDFADVVETITTKLVRRHPHVFADAEGKTAKAVEGLWERIKAQEKSDRGESAERGLGRGPGCPARVNSCPEAAERGRARRLRLERSARCPCQGSRGGGRDRSRARSQRKGRMAAEVGDLLFALVNLARHVDADPKLCCVKPISNSSAVSQRSNLRLPNVARRRKARPWSRWMSCGTRRRRPRGPPPIVDRRRPYAVGRDAVALMRNSR